MIYPQNDDRIVAIDTVTSLHRALKLQPKNNRSSNLSSQCDRSMYHSMLARVVLMCCLVTDQASLAVERRIRAFQFAIRIDSIRYVMRIDSFY